MSLPPVRPITLDEIKAARERTKDVVLRTPLVKLDTGKGGPGSRIFDVYCNGVALLRGFDIIKEAGGEGRPIDRSFSAIRPNAQGKILLTFVPVAGMACVNGIEVVDDSK